MGVPSRARRIMFPTMPSPADHHPSPRSAPPAARRNGGTVAAGSDEDGVAELRSPAAVLDYLRTRGARRLRRVSFRRNRATLWSLTRGGTRLNLHQAYRTAPEDVLDAFAVLVRTGGRPGPATERARATVRSWPGIARALRRIRQEDTERVDTDGTALGLVPCSGTPDQQAWLRDAYRHLNRTRLDGRLPDGLALRFSRRMRSSLGHMRPGTDREGRRTVLEIALNLDLVLEGNEGPLVDTLLHEMAHAASWLLDGTRDHGPSWRRWAARVGCAVRTRHTGTFQHRRRRGDRVPRVPPPMGELLGELERGTAALGGPRLRRAGE